MSTPPIHTLADFDMPIALCCINCRHQLPRHAECEIGGHQVFVKCPRCEQVSSFVLLRGDGRRLA